MKTVKNEAQDAAMEKNRKIIQNLIEKDPKMAKAFKPKKAKKAKQAQEESAEDEDFFMSSFLTLNVKSVPKEYFKELNEQHDAEMWKRRGEPNPALSQTAETTTTTARTEIENYVPQEVERIKPIRKLGNRKHRVEHALHRIYEIELDDGTIIQTNELTADILSRFQPEMPDISHLTKEQLEELEKYRTVLNREDSWDDFDPKKHAGSVFATALQSIKQQEKERKELIYQKEQRLALPIQTLTSHGIAIGAYFLRRFKKLGKEYIENIRHIKHAADEKPKLNENEYLHWEGVNFRPFRYKASIKKILVNQYYDEDYSEEEYYEEEEETFDEIAKRREIMEHMFNSRRKYGNRRGQPVVEEENSYSSIPFNPDTFVSINDPESVVDSNGNTVPLFKNPDQPQQRPSIIQMTPDGMEQFNIFDVNNKQAQQIIQESASLQNIASLYNKTNAENPLQDIIDNTEIDDNYTLADLAKKYNTIYSGGLIDPFKVADQDNLDFSIPKSNPISNSGFTYPNSRGTGFIPFTVGGLPRSEVPIGGYSKRPLSPPGMITLQTLNQDMNERHMFLPVISESSFDESVINSIAESDDEDKQIKEDDEEPISLSDINRSFPKPSVHSSTSNSSLTKTQMNVQEILTRNDFAELRNLLDEAGLLDDNTLVDQPKWQPTINFLSYHQKQLSSNNSSSTFQHISSVQSKDSFTQSERSTSNSATTSHSSIQSASTALSRQDKELIQQEREKLLHDTKDDSSQKSNASEHPLQNAIEESLSEEKFAQEEQERIEKELQKKEEENAQKEEETHNESETNSIQPEIHIIEDDSDDESLQIRERSRSSSNEQMTKLYSSENSSFINESQKQNQSAEDLRVATSKEKGTDQSITGGDIVNPEKREEIIQPPGSENLTPENIDQTKSESNAEPKSKASSRTGRSSARDISYTKKESDEEEDLIDRKSEEFVAEEEDNVDNQNEEEEMYVYEEEEIIEEEEFDDADITKPIEEVDETEESKTSETNTGRKSSLSSRKSDLGGENLPTFKLDDDDDLDISIGSKSTNRSQKSGRKTSQRASSRRPISQDSQPSQEIGENEQSQRSMKSDLRDEDKSIPSKQTAEEEENIEEDEEEDYSYSYSYSDYSDKEQKDGEKTGQTGEGGEERPSTIIDESQGATGEKVTLVSDQGAEGNKDQSTTEKSDKEGHHKHHRRHKGEGGHHRGRHHRSKKSGENSGRSKRSRSKKKKSDETGSLDGKDLTKIAEKLVQSTAQQLAGKTQIQAKTRKIKDSKVRQARERNQKEKQEQSKSQMNSSRKDSGRSSGRKKKSKASNSQPQSDVSSVNNADQSAENPPNRKPQGNANPVKIRRTIGRKTLDPRAVIEARASSDDTAEEDAPEESIKKTPTRVIRRRIKKIIKNTNKTPPGPSKRELQRQEEEELIRKLMANSMDLEVNATFNAQKKPSKPTLKVVIHKEKTEEEVLTLTTKISLDLNQLVSLDALNEREKEEIEEEKQQEEIDPQKLHIRPYFSSSNLLDKPFKERYSYKMLGETDLKLAPTVFMSFDAPSLWDKRSGKLRRNSII